jgi:hypothetical protein
MRYTPGAASTWYGIFAPCTTGTRTGRGGPRRWPTPCCWPTPARTPPATRAATPSTGEQLTTIRSRYHGAIAHGWSENATGRGPLADQARTLLRRFARYQDMILRFAFDLRVPFTNNTAELDARAAKVQQRTSGGCWRTLQGLADWAAVQSYLATARKWGIDTLDALVKLFTDGPWLPTGLTPHAA